MGYIYILVHIATINLPPAPGGFRGTQHVFVVINYLQLKTRTAFFYYCFELSENINKSNAEEFNLERDLLLAGVYTCMF